MANLQVGIIQFGTILIFTMMCDIMPTISEDGITDNELSYSSEDANLEQLMVKMLDERDRLMDTLTQTKDALNNSVSKCEEFERERDLLQKQLQASTSQVDLYVIKL